MQYVFSGYGFLFFGAHGICYLWKLSANPVLQKMGNRITILGSIKHPPLGWRQTDLRYILAPLPWARLHRTNISTSETKEDRLFKIVYRFSIISSQKHNYMNNPTTQNASIMYVAIHMARRVHTKK